MSCSSTHDKITYILAPLILVGAWWFIGYYALIIALAFLFSGLMFNGDLDLQSQVYNRWLLFRWIWLPYRRFGHRSFWTHGIIIGTLIRLLWIVIPVTALLYFTGYYQVTLPYIIKYEFEILYAIVGLELGNISHTFMDWMSTGFKKILN
jgi:uncharacterized metal-binding protein